MVTQMAAYNNAALASRFSRGVVGVLTPGAWADIIFVDYHPNTPLTPGNLPWHMLFGFHESMVTTTSFREDDADRHLTLDEEQITAHAWKSLRCGNATNLTYLDYSGIRWLHR
jgi:hypothetical protein